MQHDVITLILIDQSVSDTVSLDPAKFEEDQGLHFGAPCDRIQSIVTQNEVMLQRSKSDWHWGAYFALDSDRRIDPSPPTVIGVCSFKGKPVDGTIEIAYTTFPAFEGRGFGTAMAKALIEKARSASDISRVLAHTLPERNASCRILEKVGLSLVGDAKDEDVGRAWRWALDL